MRVVLLKSQVALQGGLEKYATRIANGFVDRKMDVTILTTVSPNLMNHPPHIPVIATKTCPWPGFLRMEQFDRFTSHYLKEHPAEIVFGLDRNRFQTHFRAGNGVHRAFLEMRGKLEGRWKQFSFRINPLHREILHLEKCAMESRFLKKLFTNSYMVRDQILAHYRTDPSIIEVIHNGVEWIEMQNDFDEWPTNKKKTAAQFNWDINQFHLLFVGNGYLRKGLLPLLKAIEQMKRSDIHLSVVGKDREQAKYQDLACRLGLEKQVHFFGPQKNIRQFYQMADALIIPSFYDPFANVTIEALAMGLFVISSRTNGGHEILNSQNGTIIENLNDTDSLIEAIHVGLRHPKTISSAKEIRRSVESYDFSSQINTLINHTLQ